MIADLLRFLYFNASFALIVAAIAFARGPVRRRFGAHAAYGIWAFMFAPAGAFLPGRTIQVSLPQLYIGPIEVLPDRTVVHTHIHLWEMLFTVWALGAVGWAVVLWRRQRRFMRALAALEPHPTEPKVWRSAGAAGPIAIGVLRPRIVVPADFAERYSPAEQGLILAHERAHLRAGDTAFNFSLTALCCLLWFNPFAHLAARLIRLDQEMARDADVLAGSPASRGIYGGAMLKAQFHDLPAPPAACYWPARSADLLKERISMLKMTPPSPRRRKQVAALLLASWACAYGVAWAAQPARRVLAQPSADPEMQSQIADAPAHLEARKRQLADYAQSHGMTLDQGAPAAAAARLRYAQVRPSAPPQVSVSNSVVRDYEPPKPDKAKVVVQPVWQSRPDIATMQAVVKATLGPDAPFPTGGAMMSCTVRADGSLNSCGLLNQTSDDVGKVTLALAPAFKMQPGLDANGTAVEGATVNIPVRFQAN